MSDLKLDPVTGDLALENGDLVLLEQDSGDTAEVAQKLRQALLFFKGEWFLDTEAGVPYHQDIFGKQRDLVLVRAILITTILDVPGVIGLNRFDLDYEPDTRSLTVDFEAESINGKVPIREVVI